MTVSPPAPAAGTTFDTPLKALNPLDGLFLRAEHLAAIQDYSRAVTRAVGRAGGAGISYGCTASVSDGVVTVTGGLAIAPTGQPLLLAEPLSERAPAPGTAAYLVVELLPDITSTGTPEQIYGLLCEDPCSGGDQFRPYLAEGVRIGFREPSLILPTWSGEDQFRSAVASGYFDDERKAALALLPTSERDPGRQADLQSSIWSTGTGPSSPGGVPIGLLIRIESDWVLDVWAARRDLIDTPPDRGWARRTGRRPGDVFLAQVLQFQAHLADLDIPVQVRSGGAPTLPDYFVELPPAGYVPIDPSSDLSVNDQVTRLLGPELDLRFCSARPDEIGLALERAQHLDRIRLSGPTRPKVDVIVPDGTVSARAAASSVRFAGGSVTLSSRNADHRYDGLARLSFAPGQAVTLGFAAAGTLEEREEALWAAVRLNQSPFELRKGDFTLTQITLAARLTQNRANLRLGEALQRFDLFGQLECLDANADPATALPTFEGQFRGQLMARIRSTTHELPVVLTVRLSVRQESSGYVLRAELTGSVTETLDFHAQRDSTGWTVSFDEGAATGRDPTKVTGEFSEIAPADVPLSPFRWAAERGLAALSATSFPLDAVSLLFAGAGPSTSEASYVTVHDWVFFTRRHLLDCGPLINAEPAAIRLDLYARDAPPGVPAVSAISVAAGALHYVVQLGWSRETGLLSPASARDVDAWRQFHPDARPVAALVSGTSMTQQQAEPLVRQILQRMGADATASVEVNGATGIPTTSGSSGILIVDVTTGGVAPPILLISGEGGGP